MAPRTRQTGGGTKGGKGKGKPATKAAKGKKAAPVVLPSTEPPPKAKKPRTPKGKGVVAQNSLLIRLETEVPGITSDQMALMLNIPPAEVFRWRHFVHEYIKDYDAVSACIRMGFAGDSAMATAKIYFNTAFVQLRIKEIQAEIRAEDVCTKGQVMSKYWEEANRPDVPFSSNSSTRISALNAIVKLAGMAEPPKPKKTTMKQTPGFVVVPWTSDPNEWEETARQSQRALKESVCLDV